MAAVTALDPAQKNSALAVGPATSGTSDVVAAIAAATPVSTTAVTPLATPEAISLVTAASTDATAGLAAPNVRSSVEPKLTKADYPSYWDAQVYSQVQDPGLQQRMQADCNRIRGMLDSCTLLVFCFSGSEEAQTLGIINSYPPQLRGAFIETLAGQGLLTRIIDGTQGSNSTGLQIALRSSFSGMSNPAVAAQILERTYGWSDPSTIAAVTATLNQTNSPAFADAVLMELVTRGVFTRALPFWSPLSAYGCDSFYDVLQQQSMAAYLESSRLQSMNQLNAVLASFPPNSQAAAILRQQLASQYSVERMNDYLAQAQCLSQPRYYDYYHTYLPDYQYGGRYGSRWFDTPYPDGRSGTGLPGSSYGYPRNGSGTGLPGGYNSGSGTGLGNGSGTGLPRGTGSGTGLGSSPRSNGSGTGLGTSQPTPRSGSGSGTGLGGSTYTPPSYTPPSYTPPRSSSGSGTGLGSSPSYTPRSTPSYTPPTYTPRSSGSGSGTGLGSSPSYTPRAPSYTPSPSYTPRSSSGSGTGLGGGSYSAPRSTPSAPRSSSSSRGSGTGL